jgi:hypothetical protein
MAENFIDRIEDYFTEEFNHHASNSLDETSTGISKALSAIIPVGLEGVARKATSGNDGAARVYDLSVDAADYYSPQPNLTDLHNDEKGSLLAPAIFGNKESHIEKSIAQYAGVRQTSVEALSLLAMPVIMGLLGKYAVENNLSANGLAGFLSSQKENIRHALPEGMSFVKELDYNSSAPDNDEIAPDINVNESSIIERPKKKTWVIPLIIILLVIALLIYLSKGCGETKRSNESAVAHSIQVSAMGSKI